jgi:hypothetical protein
MFRLLKLKPPHGWSAVAWELVIVTVGVLLALGAQQLVEGIQRRNDVAQLVAALRAELADDRARWEHIRASDPCTLQRLDAIERWLATAPAGTRLRPNPFRLFLWNMHSSAWDLAKTSPATAAIPLEGRLTYASLYGAIDNWRLFIDEENKNARAISTLLATADQPQNRAQIPVLIAQARIFVQRRKFNYDYFFKRFDRLRIAPDDSELTVVADDRRLCAPLTAETRPAAG